jgi:hypothetical protein
MDKIKDFKPSTQRNYIISIVSALKHVPTMHSMFEMYSKIMDEMNTALKKNNTKSDVQKDNWVSQEEIQQVFEKLSNETVDKFCSKRKHVTELDWEKIIETVILALYVLQPPRRILDYNSMIIVKKLPKELDKNINYYDLSTDTFYFSNYKTSRTYKTQSFKAPSKLATILECYSKIHPIKFTKEQIGLPLLCKYNGSMFDKSYSITRILNRIFKRELGKKISVNMLRSIFLTDKFGPKVTQLQDIATAMGTSSDMISHQYVKID